MGKGLAIIGLGNFGRKIIAPIKHFYNEDELYVSAICDVNEETVIEVGSEVDAIQFTDYRACIDYPSVDIVYIAVPPAFHKEVSMYALKANKHILCEKPVAHTLEDAKVMLKESEKTDRVCAMHFGQQYSPVFQTFTSLVGQGYVGEVSQIELIMDYPSWPPAWQKNIWIMTQSQGGFLLEQGVHFLHFISKLFGTIEVLKSRIDYLPSGGCEKMVDAELMVNGQIPFRLKGQWPVVTENVTMTITGTKGKLLIENWRTLKGALNNDSPTELPLQEPNGWIMDHVLDAIDDKPAQLSSFRDGYDALLTVESIRKGTV